MTFHIETDRLILREIRDTDEDGFFAMDSNPDVHRYLGNKPIKTIEEIRQYIRSLQQQYLENGIGRWAAIEKSSGQFIGWSGLKLNREGENGHSGYYDVGYRLIPKYWGQGYASESAKAAIEYGFTKMGMTEIIGTAHEENKASRRALEKCGLKFVEQFETRGLTCDWLRITKQEWESMIRGK